MTSVLRKVFLMFCALTLFLVWRASAQSTYTAQLSGVVTDSSGAVVPRAKVILTDEATNIAFNTLTDERGIYVLTGIRPAKYTIRVDAPNFASQERRDVVLAVNQEATIDFTVKPGVVSESVTITEQAPLLDTGNATLGMDVTNEYVRDIPLPDRSFFGLVFLAGGVTESAGSGIQDSYPSGTNFVSNGQRNATAEVRLDGALTSAPEQGEGGTTNVYYQPSVEIVQEFKVENNSFSAEYGNNGGTVVNLVLKEGGNQFHGSGWWYGQRSALDANDFFNNAAGIPKPDHLRDQYGFSLGGPIFKGRTFFFVDFEKVRDNSAVNFSGNVPTADERLGNFSADATNIYDPSQCLAFDSTGTCAQRQQFVGDNSNVDSKGNSLAGVPNVIPKSMIDTIGQKIINLYPLPNVQGNGFNYRQSTVASSSGYQYDIKIDHHFNQDMHLSGRYSHLYSDFSTPFFLGDGTDAAGNTINDGLAGDTVVHNAGMEFNWTLTPTTLWTSRFALDRVSSPGHSVGPTLSSVGLPAILEQANGLGRVPTIQTDLGDPMNQLSLFNQCCTDVTFAHTLFSYSSAISLVRGRHTLKAGFEQRQFLNNFGQPNYPTGYFYFPQNITGVSPTDTTGQGNSFADILLGYGDPGNSLINIQPSVADKSAETAFYFQDDFKVSSRFSVNLGLRYEWSTPYTERFNHQQYSDFAGGTGISVPLPSPLDPSALTPTALTGTTLFVGQGGLGRHLPVDRNNVAPRLGFAYSWNQKTVIRGGAGIYYGLNPATNFQYTGTAFSSSGNVLFSTDNFNTRFATLENPFPNGLPLPQGKQYGADPDWGFSNSNNLGTQTARNAEIYQWNLGFQRLLPGEITVGIDYSASRSNHLPWGGDNVTTTRNRNFLSSTVRAEISAQQHALDPMCDIDGCVTTYLNQLIGTPLGTVPFQPQPFYRYFQQVPGQPAPIFNSPASVYNQPQIPLIDLLRAYPQFAGSFTGLPNLGANAFYNSIQVRFQKRANHYVSFEGNYTLSKATDDSSAGFNAFVGTLNAGNVQQLDQLKLEHAISANDATHRFVLAAIVDLPVGRGRWIGRDMNRILDGIIGGWQAATLITRQSGQPLAFSTVEGANGNFLDGNQRPNLLCPGSQLASGISYHQAAATGQSVFNNSCFAYPGDEIPGDAPRYISTLRTDGIHNMDLSFTKDFQIKEHMSLQLRGEFFNFTNTPRFAVPNTSVDSGGFGTVTGTANTPRHTQFGVRFQF